MPEGKKKKQVKQTEAKRLLFLFVAEIWDFFFVGFVGF